MSDFFTRLAERTLGLSLTIQPIKPSLFEPEPDAGSEMPFDFTEELASPQAFTDTPISHRTVSNGIAAMAAPEHTQPGHPLSAVTSVPTATGVAFAGASLMHADSQARTSQTGQIGSRSQANHRPAPAEAFSSHSIPAQGFTQQVVAGERVEGAGPRHGNEMESEIRAASRNEFFPPSHLEQGSAGRINESGTIAMTTLSRPTSQGVAAGHQALLEGRRTRGIQPAPVAQPVTGPSGAISAELPIQVTIERVEVRAVPAPTAPATCSQQPPARSAAMSLDEYLRRQEQGGRR